MGTETMEKMDTRSMPQQNVSIVYRTSEEEVMEKLAKMKYYVFDVDGTLINLSRNDPGTDFPLSWRVLERAAGFDENVEHKTLLSRWLNLSRDPSKKDETSAIYHNLCMFWKGLDQKKISEKLYPIPYYEHVTDFFRKIHESNNGFLLAIISSGPKFYVDQIAKELGMHYADSCFIEIDKDGKFTGVVRDKGLFGKRESLEDFCKDYHIEPEDIVYHGDSYPDIEPLRLCGLGIAVNPVEGLEGTIASASDVVLYDWHEHPLLKTL